MCLEIYEMKMGRIYNIILVSVILSVCSVPLMAQNDNTFYDDGFTVTDNTFNPNRALDSLSHKHKEVPKGMHLWTIDDHFGDRTAAVPDTAQHLFMNSIFTTGMYGEYNTTGNLGAPRIARIATDRDYETFGFTDGLSYFLTPPTKLRFSNTLSPITNLSFNSCGDRTDGEDHFKALFQFDDSREGESLSLTLRLHEAYLCSNEEVKIQENKPLEEHIKFTNICSSFHSTIKKHLSKELYFPE